MRLLKVEVTEDEYISLVALRAADVESAAYTVERFLGLLLSLGGRVREASLQVGQGSSFAFPSQGGGPSAAARASHRDRDRAGWRNGAA